jgi:hypothetical protein
MLDLNSDTFILTREEEKEENTVLIKNWLVSLNSGSLSLTENIKR